MDTHVLGLPRLLVPHIFLQQFLGNVVSSEDVSLPRELPMLIHQLANSQEPSLWISLSVPSIRLMSSAMRRMPTMPTLLLAVLGESSRVDYMMVFF